MKMAVSSRWTAPFLLLLLSLLVATPEVNAGSSDGLPVAPRLNDGHKWRIGYYQGGSYGNYRDSLLAIVRGLEQLGWL